MYSVLFVLDKCENQIHFVISLLLFFYYTTKPMFYGLLRGNYCDAMSLFYMRFIVHWSVPHDKLFCIVITLSLYHV